VSCVTLATRATCHDSDTNMKPFGITLRLVYNSYTISLLTSVLICSNWTNYRQLNGNWCGFEDTFVSIEAFHIKVCTAFVWTDFPNSTAYSRIPGRRNHRNEPASVFLSTHWWSQHPACQCWLFLVVSCFYKPFRNCHSRQRVSKVQCKKLAKKIFLYWDFMLDFWGDVMLIF